MVRRKKRAAIPAALVKRWIPRSQGFKERHAALCEEDFTVCFDDLKVAVFVLISEGEKGIRGLIFD